MIVLSIYQCHIHTGRTQAARYFHPGETGAHDVDVLFSVDACHGAPRRSDRRLMPSSEYTFDRSIGGIAINSAVFQAVRRPATLAVHEGRAEINLRDAIAHQVTVAADSQDLVSHVCRDQASAPLMASPIVCGRPTKR
jgi:hypothetical protein